MKPILLIADDSASKRELLRHYVEKLLDVEIVEATTSDEAMHLIDQHVEIAAGLIDFEIPPENGPAIIRYLKHRNTDALIALATSAGPGGDYEAQARAAGAEAFISTSWDIVHMEEVLTTLLAGWGVELQNR